MSEGAVNLSKFDNRWYKQGPFWKLLLWYVINRLFFATWFPHPSPLKRWIIILFGGKVGKSVVIKPRVYIKYPWFLEIGSNSWIGENVWIDNLTYVRIGNNVCISQGTYIGTGNHNYKKETFDLMVESVVIEDGAWVGAFCVICPGSHIATHTVLYSGTVFSGKSEPYTIYRGNPAVEVKKRIISS